MIIRSLLAALNVDKSSQILALMGERENFMSTLGLLRHGHEKLNVRPAKRPEVLRRLARLEKEWSVFGPAFSKIINTGIVTQDNVAIVAECIKPLEEGTRHLVDVYEFFATGGRTFSAVTPMVKNAEEMQALLKEMAAEYLLIAYGYEVKSYRTRLGQSYRRFDRTLKGLIKGDPEMRIVPAPNRGIDTALRGLQRSWYPLALTVYHAAKNGKAPRAVAPKIKHQVDMLSSEMGRAINLYKLL